MYNFNANELKIPINYIRKKICAVFPNNDNLIENCLIILTELIVATLLLNGVFYILYKRRLNKIENNISIKYFLLQSFNQNTANISTVNSNENSNQPMSKMRQTRSENETTYQEINEVDDSAQQQQINQNQKANIGDFSDTGYSSRN